jgi:arsenate reductase
MRYVLFVCTHNAGRSQMAQALFARRAPDDVRAESAGTQPRREVWPEVVEVMRELDVDLAGRRPTKLTVEMQLHADWAVTMGCGDVCPYVPTTVEDWDLPDPAGKPIDEVRAIRDAVEVRVNDLIEQRLDAIRSDDSAHQFRLRKLLPPLVKEFGDTRGDEDIRACADAILAEYKDVPIRGYVMTLAERRARECLRADHCDVLATRDRVTV